MSELVLVTGASGFLASHIVYLLAQQGYRVRGTARSKKAAALREAYKTLPSVEIVDVEDIAHDQFGEALKGVDAVIHTASPLPGRDPIEIMLKTAIDGSLNVLNQAEKAGVKKIVVTSSVAAAGNDPKVPGLYMLAELWNPITKETLPPNDYNAPYSLSKTAGERAVWEWAKVHPHVSVTTILPPLLYGPLPPVGIHPAPGDFNAFTTSICIYNLIFPTGTFPAFPVHADVRDAANAHIRALSAAFSSKAKGQRLIVGSPHGIVFKDVVELIRRERPELNDRLITASAPELPFDRLGLDFGRVEELIGMKKEDFHTIDQTILDTVDSLIKMEAEWNKSGYVVTKVPAMQF